VQLVQPLASVDDLGAARIPEGLLRALVPRDATYKVEVDVIGEGMQSQELVEHVGGWAKGQLQCPANLKQPTTIVHATMAGGRIWIGLDLAGMPLARRDWRIMTSRRSLKATIAAACALAADIRPGQRVLDPIADDGTLAIEAALLLADASVRKFVRAFAFERLPALAGTDWAAWRAAQDDAAKETMPIRAFTNSLGEMKAVRTHSKLAGAEELVHATRVTVDWIDLKLEESSIDTIITHPVESGRALEQRKALARNDDLFNQAAYLLRRGGSVTCISSKPGELREGAQRHGFRVGSERTVWMGKLQMGIVTFTR
jgi:23S rRNA G2445 N2-methylase RlmL